MEASKGAGRGAVKRSLPRIVVRCASSAALLLVLVTASGLSQTAVRVGVYDNPPKVTIDDSGAISGLYPDLLRAIAAEEGWTLEYVPGTWTESMARLERGELDVMVDVAFSPPRRELYAFNNETVLVNWGTVYTRTGLKILSLPELEGLRVAVMRDSTHTVDPGGIVDLAERFGIRCTFIEFDSYEQVFAALAAGSADAGVVNRVFGLTFASEYGVEPTPIVFNPIELRFAFPSDGPLTPLLIARIDQRLIALKSDPDSLYYRKLVEYLLVGPGRQTLIRWPAWLLPALVSAGVLIGVLIAAVLVIRREARQRARAEEAHRRSEERFALAMRGANDGLWDWDLVTGHVDFSPRWTSMLGYDVGELEPTIATFRRLIHPDDVERVQTTEADYLAGRTSRYQAEFRMLHHDGHSIDVLSRAFLVRDANGRPRRIVGTHVDISERKRAEEKLREREAYLRTIIDHMPVDFFSIDRNMRYTMQSPVSKETVGDVVGRRADELDVPGDLLRSWLDELHRVFSGETVRQEYDMPTLHGEMRTYLSEVAPVRVEGEIVAAIGTSMDITERQQVARALQESKDRAEAADRMKSAFLATMSHELRTPLNSIIGFTGILLQKLAGPLTDEQAKQLGMVQTSARHLLALINDVLDISKIEAGQLEVFPEPFDLPDLIRETVEAARPAATAKGLELRADLAPTVGTIRSDRLRVGQIVTNLLSNAVKFTSEGHVLVSCVACDCGTAIAVEDTGIGIAQQDLDKLFVPFQQIDTGLTRRYEGTGLGLSISKRLIEKLGGTIEVESEPDHGSTFVICLPRDA